MPIATMVPEVTPAAPDAWLDCPRQTLDELAARFRPAGIFITVVGWDGTIHWHDPGGSAFFQQYLLPQLSRRILTQPSGHDDSALRTLPGAILAVRPLTQRQRTVAHLVLAGCVKPFTLTEEVHRACGRLKLDVQWLARQADAIPPCTPGMLAGQLQLLHDALADRLRVERLEDELYILSNQLANTYEELSLIYQISGGTRIDRPPAEFFERACLDVLEVTGVRGVGIALGVQSAHLQPPVLYGPLQLPQPAVEQIGTQLITLLNVRQGPLLLDDLPGDPRFGWLKGLARQLIAVPLLRQDQVLGCLFALDRVEGQFDSADVKLLSSIANASAIYLENVMLFGDVHGLMMGLVHSLTSAVDAKDAYTCGHSDRVALISRRLAREAGLAEPTAERIYLAGLLHDVGKIGVPEVVLQKTGKLTDLEFQQMKQHPEIGARILQDVKQVADIIPGVMHHHERFDGRGYPARLAGDAIPLMGRIICLADSFDAMTSNRTYRRAMPLEVAMNEIRRCAGTQFDPELAEAFLRLGAAQVGELLSQPGSRAGRIILPRSPLQGQSHAA